MVRYDACETSLSPFTYISNSVGPRNEQHSLPVLVLQDGRGVAVVRQENVPQLTL